MRLSSPIICDLYGLNEIAWRWAQMQASTHTGIAALEYESAAEHLPDPAEIVTETNTMPEIFGKDEVKFQRIDIAEQQCRDILRGRTIQMHGADEYAGAVDDID